jgi:hypothetical protein
MTGPQSLSQPRAPSIAGWKRRQDLIDDRSNEVGDRGEGELRLDLRRRGYQNR